METRHLSNNIVDDLLGLIDVTQTTGEALFNSNKGFFWKFIGEMIHEVRVGQWNQLSRNIMATPQNYAICLQKLIFEEKKIFGSVLT